MSLQYENSNRVFKQWKNWKYEDHNMRLRAVNNSNKKSKLQCETTQITVLQTAFTSVSITKLAFGTHCGNPHCPVLYSPTSIINFMYVSVLVCVLLHCMWKNIST